MKKYTYICLLVSVLGFMGCDDTNVLTPSVTNPNKAWDLAHFFSIGQATTTAPFSSKITSSIDRTRGEIVIKNIIVTDAKSEMRPTSTVLSKGSSIEIVYTDQSPIGTTPALFNKNVEMTHRYTINQEGSGTGAKIPVLVRYVYPDVNMGANRLEEFSIEPK